MIHRTLESEVMYSSVRAEIYARADFSDVNRLFVSGFIETHPATGPRKILDLGCGPADIPVLLARREPACHIVGVDASPAMLKLARSAVKAAGLPHRIDLIEAKLPGLKLKDGSFAAVISNSLLHHLPDPAVFWSEVRRLGGPGAEVFVMDLFRPESYEIAMKIVEDAAGGEHLYLKEDFYNSLIAAFTLEEVNAQLEKAGLNGLRAEVISERHWLVSGKL